MSSRQNSIPTLGSGFPIPPTTPHALYNPRGEPQLHHSQGGSQPGVLVGPQGGESQANHGLLITSDNRLLLSPSSLSSNFQYSTRESSLPSFRYPDQSSQSSYPHSPEEYYQPSYPQPEMTGKAMGTFLDEREPSIARQEELFSYPARRSGIPLGFEHLLHPPEQTKQIPVERTLADPVPPKSLNPSSRFRLHMRQQPIATRACAAGEKDRRPVDPPPILQMLLVDFNPDSETDQAILQNPQYVVGCLLYSVQRSSGGGEQEKLVHSSHVVETMRKRQSDSPIRGINFSSASNEQQLPHRRFVQILSGRTHVSPFYTPSDPDPETAPEYPRSTPTSSHSSSYGYFPYPHSHPHPRHHRHHTHTNTRTMPATFFVFPDLSVRAAGTYRLRFRLMDWGITAETGTAQPILAETFSEPFRVYTSKDFPGMRGSSTLTWNLRKMGMLDLKPREGRGKGRGKGKGKVKEKEKETEKKRDKDKKKQED